MFPKESRDCMIVYSLSTLSSQQSSRLNNIITNVLSVAKEEKSIYSNSALALSEGISVVIYMRSTFITVQCICMGSDEGH